VGSNNKAIKIKNERVGLLAFPIKIIQSRKNSLKKFEPGWRRISLKISKVIRLPS
jgi:hypothetical protein